MPNASEPPTIAPIRVPGSAALRPGEPASRPVARPEVAEAVRELRARQLLIPVENIDASALRSSFTDARSGGRMHEAIDILAPRHTPIRAVDDGTIADILTSPAGGLMIYQDDPGERYTYFYAHLQRYAAGLREGMSVRRGDVIGYVGTSGNAPPDTPHLHFAIYRTTRDSGPSDSPDSRSAESREPIDPFDVFVIGPGPALRAG
jgi:murein DD-endopeptidase MepM/ murein hydrolase activator NlpD